MRPACGSTRGVAVLVLGWFAQSVLVHAQGREDFAFSAPSSVVQGSGARALGMGGAFLARADDATAVSWNPAGLSYLAKPEICLVGAHKGFNQRSTDDDGTALFEEHFEGTGPDFVSGAWPVRIGSTPGSVQLAYQRVLGFTGTRTWSRVPSAFPPGTQPSIEFAADSTGGYDTISMAAGFRVARPLRLGFVVNRWLNGFEERRERFGVGERASVQEATFELSGWSANIGVIVHPVEAVNIGFVYKWAFEADVQLRRSRYEEGALVDSRSGPARLAFPSAIGAGLSWRIISPLTVSADFTRAQWSKGRIFDYFDLGKPPTTYGELLYPTLVRTPDQVDSDQWRMGAEYVVVGRKLSIPLRAGFFLDRQYFVDADGAAPNYYGLTVGAGVIVRGILLDVAFVRQRGHYPDRAWVAQSGQAEIKTHQVYASLIYRFGSN